MVRRKVGEPTDVSHTKSRKLKRQRGNLTLASQHYSGLTPSQKAITRHQIEEVEYQKSHGKTDTKLLVGRQLFISKEMHSLATTQKQLVLPHELCIMLVDEYLNPLAGTLQLFYYAHDQWWDLKSDELRTGNWLFSQVPKGQEAYRPYGQAYGYFDPELPETQFMTEDEIRAYHYHKLLFPVDKEILYPNGDGDPLQLGASGLPHWQMVLYEDTIFYPPDEIYIFGHFEGNYIFKHWWPSIWLTDIFTFTDPLYAAQYINKLTLHCLLDTNTYAVGFFRGVLKTHGQLYYSDTEHFPFTGPWFSPSWEKNPYTNEAWTRDEVIALQAGITAHAGTSPGGLVVCDQIKIELTY